MSANEHGHYAPVQKGLHWTMAALIAVMVVVGLLLPRIGPGPVTNLLFEVHKSIGIIVLALVAVRLVVRLRLGAPPLESDLPAWQQWAARISHVVLYGLMVVIPIAGWAATSGCCRPVNFLGLVPVTLPVPSGDAFSKPTFQLHFLLAFILIGVLAVHIGAALHHHFSRRDGTLRRMLPGRPEGG